MHQRFYSFLIEEELMENNPILPFRKRYLRKYKSDNDSEIRKLISIDDSSKLVNSVLDTRDRCIIVLLFKTGMRLGELLSLDLDDIGSGQSRNSSQAEEQEIQPHSLLG